MQQHQQPTHFTPFTPAVRTPTNPQQPTQFSAGLNVRGGGGGGGGGEEQPFNGQKSSRICRHYQRGRCTWGEHCRFLHEGGMVSKEDRYGGPNNYDVGGGGGGGFMVSGGQNGQSLGSATGGNGSFSSSTTSPTVQSQGTPTDPASKNLLLGLNQSRLQAMRHAKLITALKGTYEMQPTETPGQVQIVAAGLDPDFVTFLSDQQLQQAYTKLDEDDRFKEAGLLMYIVGEPNVFYTAVRLFTTAGSCGHPRLDHALQAASTQGLVECMFYRSAAGCQAPKCGYEHRPLGPALGSNNGSPTSLQQPSFTAQQQRFTSSSSLGPRSSDQSLGDSLGADDRKGGPGGPPGEFGQWDHLEKVVDSLKAVGDEDDKTAWTSTGVGPFFAVTATESSATPIW